MKHFATILLAIVMAFTLLSSAMAETFEPSEFIDWYINSYAYETVETGYYSQNPEDQMTDEEIVKVLDFAMKVQTGRSKSTNTYFVVVKDYDEQVKILGDDWQKAVDKVSPGTVILLEYADCVLTEDEGHVSPYQGAYSAGNMAYYAAGQTAELVCVAASALGYYNHIYGGFYGEYTPYDIAGGKYVSGARYLSDADVRVIGHDNAEGTTEYDPETIKPVLGNCVLVTAIVLGKPVADVDILSAATKTARPSNYKFWDGTVNESAVMREIVEKDEETKQDNGVTADSEIVLEENQYLGEAQGMDDIIRIVVTVKDGTITDVNIVYANETPNIGTLAIEQLPDAIVSANSTEVDAVTGATVTSNAIIEAVNNALAQVE